MDQFKIRVTTYEDGSKTYMPQVKRRFLFWSYWVSMDSDGILNSDYTFEMEAEGRAKTAIGLYKKKKLKIISID